MSNPSENKYVNGFTESLFKYLNGPHGNYSGGGVDSILIRYSDDLKSVEFCFSFKLRAIMKLNGATFSRNFKRELWLNIELSKINDEKLHSSYIESLFVDAINEATFFDFLDFIPEIQTYSDFVLFYQWFKSEIIKNDCLPVIRGYGKYRKNQIISIY